MSRLLVVLVSSFTFGAVVVAAQPATSQTTAELGSPFAWLDARRGQQPVRVPPRALAVIPERHTGRLLRLVDELDAIEPQFDDFARGMGLSGESAIQLRTVEARIPIFLRKNEATIATLLQVPLGAQVEIEGVLLERGSRYLLLASDVRPTSRRGRAR